MPHCRGVVKTALLLEGEDNTVTTDPMRTSYLEIHTTAGTSGDPCNAAVADGNSSNTPTETAGEIW